jgi:F-type H+-transporting ATPase subunit delta
MSRTRVSISRGSLPRRYAKALIQLAQEENQVESFGARLESLSKVFGQTPELLATLTSEFIPYDQRRSAVEEIAHKAGYSPTFTHFLLLLLKKERLLVLPAIAREYQRLQDEVLGIVRVAVMMPSPPDPETLKRVQTILSGKLGKNVIAEGEVQPEMIGGIMIRVNHTVYDGSIRRELERMRETILRG